MTVSPIPAAADIRIHLCGAFLTPTCEGALWWPDQATLIVSDLHLEKGSSFAARGQMLPPYDTGATLAIVEAAAAAYRPRRIISLGDSFHDMAAADRLAPGDADRLRALTGAVDWLWVEGNHDPDPPTHLGGRTCREARIGPLVFRHEPTGAAGEVAGHLHPCAKVRRRNRSVRRRCFITDGERLIMPALGAFTGGLNVCDAAFSAVFTGEPIVFALGRERVHPIAAGALSPDGAPASVWRL